MRYLLFFLSIFALSACNQKQQTSALVTNDLPYFSLFSPTCERWLENKYACKAKKDCFTGTAVEIVGVDTSNTDSIKVYAWCWVQQFKSGTDSIPLASLGKILAAEFTVSSGGREYKIIRTFVADENKSLKEQLEERLFPEELLKTYFIKQDQQVEVERIKSLSQKAEEKFKMYQEKAYLQTNQPTPLPVVPE